MALRELVAAEYASLQLFAPTWFYMLSTAAVTQNTVNYFASLMGSDTWVAQDTYLAGIGLGSILHSCSIMGFMLGYSTVFDVYGPQLCGRAQRARLGTLLVKCLLQGALLYLLALGPYYGLMCLVDMVPSVECSAEARDVTNRYMSLMSGTVFLEFAVDLLFKFFTNHNYMTVVYVMAVAQSVSFVAFCYLLVIGVGMKTEGLVVALVCSRILTLLGSVVVMVSRATDLGLRRRILSSVWENWGAMLRIGLACGANFVLLEIGYVVAICLTQLGGAVNVAALAILLRVEAISLSSSVALAYTTAIQVGNALGQGDEIKMRYFIKLGFFNTLIERLLFVSLFLTFRLDYIAIFSTDPVVLAVGADASYYLAAILVLQNLQQFVCRGVLLALGRARFVSLLSMFAVVVCGTPIMFLLAWFTDLHVRGLLLGVLLERGIVVCGAAVRSAMLRFSEEVARCDARLAAGFRKLEGEAVPLVQGEELTL